LNAPIGFHHTESLANRRQHLRAHDRISIRKAYAAERRIDIRRQRYVYAGCIETAHVACFQWRLRPDRVGNRDGGSRFAMPGGARGKSNDKPDAEEAPEQQRRAPS
jgi:hypothetical protein